MFFFVELLVLLSFHCFFNNVTLWRWWTGILAIYSRNRLNFQVLPCFEPLLLKGFQFFVFGRWAPDIACNQTFRFTLLGGLVPIKARKARANHKDCRNTMDYEYPRNTETHILSLQKSTSLAIKKYRNTKGCVKTFEKRTPTQEKKHQKQTKTQITTSQKTRMFHFFPDDLLPKVWDLGTKPPLLEALAEEKARPPVSLWRGLQVLGQNTCRF